MRAAIGALIAVLLWSVSASADTTVDNKQLADKLFLEGRELLNKEQYDAACKKFHAAQDAEKQNVAILLNLGLCYEKQNKLAQALKWYRKTQTAATESTNKDPAIKEYEDAAKERTADLASKVSKITFSLGAGFQADAEVLMDGQAIDKNELIVEADKGTHVIEARAPGKMTSRKELVVDDNGKSLTYTFAPLVDAPTGASASRSKRRIMGIAIGGGVFAVSLGVSGILAAKVKSDNPGASDSDYNSKMVTPNAVWIGGLAVGAAIATYFILTKPKTETNQTAFTPVVSGDQVGVSMFRRF